MTDKEIIINGCEFQSDCIEYKDISYLKIMPICAIHELSIACRDKVNKCKYYTLYKQLERKEEEYKKLKRVKDNFFKHAEISHEAVLNKNKIIDEQEKQLDQLKVENEELKKKIKYMEEYIKTVENSRNEFEKESKFLKEEIQKL